MGVSMKLFIAFDDNGEPCFYIFADNLEEAREHLTPKNQIKLHVCRVSEERILRKEPIFV